MRRRTGFQARHFARTIEGQLIVAFFVLLYLVGGGLIWGFYGRAAALLGVACITGGLFFFLLLYAIMLLIGYWAGE
jgi:hypothetical protein